MNYKSQQRYGSPHMPDRRGAAPKIGYPECYWITDELAPCKYNWATYLGKAAKRLNEQRQVEELKRIEEQNRRWREARYAEQIVKHYGQHGGVW